MQTDQSIIKLPLADRAGHTFCATGRAVCLDIAAIDLLGLGKPAFLGLSRKDAGPDAPTAPPVPAIIDRRRWAVFRRALANTGQSASTGVLQKKPNFSKRAYSVEKGSCGIGWRLLRIAGERRCHPAQAGARPGIGFILASLRRFWAAAARWNSSFAPFGPRRRKRSSFRMRLRWANSISTFFRWRLETR